jgi:HK97 family phage major capsid protein
MFQDAKDTLEATKFLSGAGHGSNEPQGLLVGATAVVQTAATATLATGDFYSLVQALAPRWQPRARLVAAPQTWDTAYRLVGGNSTEPPVLPTREGPLLGRPKYELSPMTAAASTAPTTGGSIVTVGDFRQFLIVDRIGMSVELIPHLFATANNRPMGARGLYAYWRNSSQVLTPLAFRTLKVK